MVDELRNDGETFDSIFGNYGSPIPQKLGHKIKMSVNNDQDDFFGIENTEMVKIRNEKRTGVV